MLFFSGQAMPLELNSLLFVAVFEIIIRTKSARFQELALLA